MDAFDIFMLFIQVACCLAAVSIFLSPAPSIWQIHKTNSTGPVAVIPLVAMLASDYMWMVHAIVIKEWFPLFTTFSIGTVICAVYICVFAVYAESKKTTLVSSAIAVVFCLLVSAFVVLGSTMDWCSHETLDTVTGVLGMCGTIALYASPFVTLKKVFETKDVAYIPMAMVFMGVISNSLWTFKSVVDKDAFVGIPSLIGLIFGLIQTAFYLVYRRRGAVAGSAAGSSLQLVDDDLLENGFGHVALRTPKSPKDSNTTSPSSSTSTEEHSS